jgi:hypothetical protein
VSWVAAGATVAPKARTAPTMARIVKCWLRISLGTHVVEIG